jgi:hypothetical protein
MRRRANGPILAGELPGEQNPSGQWLTGRHSLQAQPNPRGHEPLYKMSKIALARGRFDPNSCKFERRCIFRDWDVKGP